MGELINIKNLFENISILKFTFEIGRHRALLFLAVSVDGAREEEERI